MFTNFYSFTKEYEIKANIPVLSLPVFQAPLVRIKQAIQQLKKESTQMDVRSGVVEHILLQAKLKDKTLQNKQVHAGGGGADNFII